MSQFGGTFGPAILAVRMTGWQLSGKDGTNG